MITGKEVDTNAPSTSLIWKPIDWDKGKLPTKVPFDFKDLWKDCYCHSVCKWERQVTLGQGIC